MYAIYDLIKYSNHNENRMLTKNLIIAIAVISVFGVSGGSIVQQADATDICGLMFCADYPGGKEAYQKNWTNEFRGIDSHNHHSSDSKSHNMKGVVPSSHNADEEFPAKLDVFIHKFELDKISANEALEGIEEVHKSYVNSRITTEIIEDVGDKISLHNNGVLNTSDAVEAIHLSAEPQNVNPEYQGALDEVIHKFELDKISANEALEGIEEVHNGFVDLYITSDLIEAVGEKIALIDSGKLSGSDAVEAIHLSAEPQNVNPEFIGALDEYLHKFELGKMTADKTITGVIDTYEGLTSLYISSELIENVGIQINIYESGNDSAEHVLHEIHEEIEEVEAKMAALQSVDGEVPMKELPPNTVDMPAGAGVPGCEEHEMCYYPTHLTVHVGDTVTWINSDGSIPHMVTSGWPDSDQIGENYPGGHGFDSDFMSGGASFMHTFDTPGEYDYYCQLHPWMIGSITVE